MGKGIGRRIRRGAAAVALGVVGVTVPLTLTATAASAKSCKWVQVSYDPVTGTSVWQCVTSRP